MANASKARTPRSPVVSPVVSPVALLREQVTKLDAAMVVCRATPKKEPVHSLRKATRYVEAQLALLELVPGLPPHKAQADKVRKRLKTVRQAAGTIRDFDVQQGLVRDDAPAKAAVRKNASDADGRIRHDAKALAKYLKRQREHDTAKLTDVLGHEEQRLAKAMKKLEDALEGSAERTIPATRLAANIERWFRANTPHLPANGRNGKSNGQASSVDDLDEDALHALRKASKLCRYMAESLPAEFADTKRLTGIFEELQESGGKWHDWLLLRQIAAKRQGKRAALPKRYGEHRDTALAGYQSRLVNLLLPDRTAVAKAPNSPGSG
jgi:CHAD domain-containing protein